MAGRWRQGWKVASVVLAVALVAAACGDDDDDDDAGSGADTTTASAGGTDTTGADTTGGDAAGDEVAAAQAEVDRLLAPVEEWPAPPPSPTPPEDQTLFVISIDQRLEGAVRGVDGVEQAAEILGWDTVVVDGQSSPDAMSAGVSRAVSEGADGIILIYISDVLAQAGLAEAAAAGIPVVSVLSGNAPSPEGVAYDLGDADYNYGLGAALANYAIATSDGDVQAVVLRDTSFILAGPITDGTVETIEACSTCAVLDVPEFTSMDVTTRLAELTRTAITRSPGVNWVMAPYDAAASFAIQGIRDSGVEGILAGATGANTPNLELIRNGDIQVVSIGQPLEWFSFVAVDQLNRLLNDEETVPAELPLRIIDATNAPAAGEVWTGDFDFVAQYTELWGR